MIITFNTQHFFKLQAGDTVIALNPLASNGKKKVSKFGSDIVLQSAYEPEALENTRYGDKEPLEIYGPGDYEVQGLQFQGFNVVVPDGEPQNQTVFTFMFDDVRIGVLGGVDTKALLVPEALEALDEADVIFAPGTNEGFELASSFSPHAIILTGYDNPKEVKDIIETLSQEQYEQLGKLTFKKKDLAAKQNFVYVFST
jgi:hypothetical protein